MFDRGVMLVRAFGARAAILAAALGLGLSVTAQATPSETVLYTFPATGKSGAFPLAGLARDAAGNLYGTTEQGGKGFGTVFQLAPPPAGKTKWTIKILHKFAGGSDGAYGDPGLVIDGHGNVYGATESGGNSLCNTGCGTVFELAPPSGTKKGWTYTVLHRFTGYVAAGGSDSAFPHKTMALDPAGNLYGVTSAGGTHNFGSIFELSPPASGQKLWTESVLFSFCTNTCPGGNNPQAGVVRDSAGNLYGTNEEGGSGGSGTVYELKPPAVLGGAWTIVELHGFTQGADGLFPNQGVTLLPSGALIGANSGGGSHGFGHVFQLTPPPAGQTAWTKTTLYSFCSQANCTDGNNPQGAVLYDTVHGTIFGTTLSGGGACPPNAVNQCGTVFKLSPAGGGTWTETVLHSFLGPPTEGYRPEGGSVLVEDGSGHIFGTTPHGGKGASSTYGTVFEVTP